MATQAKRYVAVFGIDHVNGRDEPGEPYTGPEDAVKWLLKSGAIAPAPERASARTQTRRGK